MSQPQNLERLKANLEQQVATLNSNLRRWQSWFIEYESLKEALEDAPPNLEEHDLLRIKDGFGRDLLAEKEVDEILGLSPARARNVAEITSQVDRRIDYVQRNVETIQRQLGQTHERLRKIDAVAEEITTEDGLPLTEISEKLDEDGNVVSGHISHPGDAGSALLDTLKKAGVKEGDLPPDPVASANFQPPPQVVEGPDKQEASVADASQSAASSVKPAASKLTRSESLGEGTTLPNGGKKSVSFADGSVPRKDAAVEDLPRTLKSNTTELAKASFGPQDRVIQLDENDEIVGVNDYVMPEGDTAEEAAIRREMLQYSMSEVGSIVAQLDLEEQGSDMSWSDDDEDEDDDIQLSDAASAVSASDGEDEHGVSKKSNISNRYRSEMADLEKRLSARMLQNLGPQPDAVQDEQGGAKSAHRLVVRPEGDSGTIQPSTTTASSPTESAAFEGRKTVRFAEELDVARPRIETVQGEDADTPMTDTVLERGGMSMSSINSLDQQQPPSQKQSRFKAQRAQRKQPEMPTGPHDRIIAESVIERPPQRRAWAPGDDDDEHQDGELRPEAHRQQVASEYYRRRNAMMKQQGGSFTGQLEEHRERQGEVDELGLPLRRKVSLFKAARLSRRDGGGGPDDDDDENDY